MRSLRRLGLLAATAAGSAVLAGPALATAPDPSLTRTLGTTHFLVHYTTDKAKAFAVTDTQAGDVGALAERALSAELADGYSAPPPDAGFGGDNRVDIFLQGIASQGELGEADPLAAGPAPGYIILDAATGASFHVVAHELFHLMQFARWASTDPTDAWIYEAASEWMGYRADSYGTAGGQFPISVGNNDFSLDCRDPLAGGIECKPDVYYNDGYSRWSFFEFLNERYGPAFVDSVFTQLAIGGDGTSLASLTNALTAKGTTLAATYGAWALAELTDSYSIKALQGLHPTAYATIQTGVDAGALSVPKVDVNHLAMRFVKFTRGDDDASHACYAATLNLSVAIPAGVTSAPAFFWDAKGSSPTLLPVSGGTATAAIPWDTCTYQSNAGWLVLPNASTNVDAADFVVSANMTVDTTKPASPVGPPDPISVTTPVVPVSGADVAPMLDLFGPEVLKLSPAETQLRLIVESNGPGTVKAALGSTVLGTVSVRGGNNDLRFKLPGALLRALRRAAATANLLTLTPTAPNGTTVGQAVTRTIQVVQPKVKASKRRK